MATGKYLHQIQPQHSRIHEDPEIPILALSRYAYVILIIGPAAAGKSTIANLLGQGARRYSGAAVAAVPIRGAHVVVPPAPITDDGFLHDTRAYPHLVIDDPHPDKIPSLLRLWVPRPKLVVLQAPLDVRRLRVAIENFDQRELAGQERLSRTIAAASDLGCTPSVIENADTPEACVREFEDQMAGFLKGHE